MNESINFNFTRIIFHTTINFDVEKIILRRKGPMP